jgi:antitoxin PrlF
MPYYQGNIVLEAAMATKVTDEGQVTIPKPVLEHLGIGPGSEVAFRRAADGSIVIEKAVATTPLDPDRFAKLRGDAGPGLTTDEIMAMTRGE